MRSGFYKPKLLTIFFAVKDDKIHRRMIMLPFLVNVSMNFGKAPRIGQKIGARSVTATLKRFTRIWEAIVHGIIFIWNGYKHRILLT